MVSSRYMRTLISASFQKAKLVPGAWQHPAEIMQHGKATSHSDSQKATSIPVEGAAPGTNVRGAAYSRPGCTPGNVRWRISISGTAE